MSKPEFNDEIHWIESSDWPRVLMKDLDWEEMIPNTIWVAQHKGWIITWDGEKSTVQKGTR